MVKSCLYLFFIIGLTAVLSVFLWASGGTDNFNAKRQLVAQLSLTDLALCSEARYTRHPSQADLFSAFQDFPGSFEHFPTGSLIPPSLPGFNDRVRFIKRMDSN